MKSETKGPAGWEIVCEAGLGGRKGRHGDTFEWDEMRIACLETSPLNILLQSQRKLGFGAPNKNSKIVSYKNSYSLLVCYSYSIILWRSLCFLPCETRTSSQNVIAVSVLIVTAENAMGGGSIDPKQNLFLEHQRHRSTPIGSMYAIYGNIYHQYTHNVSIYTSTMDPMGQIINRPTWAEHHQLSSTIINSPMKTDWNEDLAMNLRNESFRLISSRLCLLQRYGKVCVTQCVTVAKKGE
jgi:hypothetical protein